MPLYTQLVRNGEPITMVWDHWALGAIVQAIESEVGPVKGYPSHTFTHRHGYTDDGDPPTLLEILPGDEFICHR